MKGPLREAEASLVLAYLLAVVATPTEWHLIEIPGRNSGRRAVHAHRG